MHRGQEGGAAAVCGVTCGMVVNGGKGWKVFSFFFVKDTRSKLGGCFGVVRFGLLRA